MKKMAPMKKHGIPPQFLKKMASKTPSAMMPAADMPPMGKPSSGRSAKKRGKHSY